VQPGRYCALTVVTRSRTDHRPLLSPESEIH
jgi:hypothetical protein